MTDKPAIAFLGLGTMGGGMARRLIAAGHHVALYNRNTDKAQALAAESPATARAAATPRDAAKGANILISMLADDVASHAVWLGDQGALAGAQAGAIAIECSTVTIEHTRDLAAEATARGLQFLDAPVTGTKPHAAKGELVFLVGGDAKTLEAVRPILALMSKEMVHVGPTTSGAALKLINNFICGVQAAALAEANVLLKRAGLDAARALPVLVNGAPGSPLVKMLYTRHSTNDPTVNFQLRLMAKDLTYAIEEGKRLGVNLKTATAALEQFRQATAAFGDQDLSAIIRSLEQA